VLEGLQYVFVGVLTAEFGIRIATAFTAPQYMNAPVQESEKQEYQNSRNHTITLAAFAIGAIALVSSRDDLESLNFEYGIAFLSGAMFCFFIGSYLFIFQNKQNWLPYVGETLEFVGVLSLAIGLFYVISELFPASLSLPIIYWMFFSVLVGIASYELYLNKRALNAGRGKRGQRES
jgi:hypothetical protein